MKEKDLINYAKTLLNNTLTLDEKTISELAHKEIKSKKALLEDLFLRNKNKDKKAFFIFGGYGSGKKEFASALNELYQIDFIEHTEIKKYCKYYNGANSHLFEKASLEGVNILMDTVLNKSYSFILDGRFFEFIDSALEKNYEIEINFVYRPLDIAIKSIEILENTFYSEFLSSINAVNKLKEKYSNVRVNFYDLHNDLVFKDIEKKKQKMNISISNHAIKRRKHYTPIDKDILINLVKQIDEKYHISKKDNNAYKIAHNGAIAIIKKTDDSLFLVTAYGFKRYDYKIDNINFKVSIALSMQERKKIREDNKGIIYKIYRINFLGKKVECGSISDISKSKHSKDKKQIDNFKYKIVLDWKLFIKFENIPMKHYHLYFNNFDEISNIVHFQSDVLMLNNYKRKNSSI